MEKKGIKLNKSKTNGFDMSSKVLNQLPTTVMAVDNDMKLIFMNAEGLKLVGKELDEVIGLRCADVFHSKHCDTKDCRMVRAMKNDQSYSARNEINIDGELIPIEYFTAPLKDDNGEIIGGLEYVLDLTERVKQEDRLRSQAKTIREISTPAIKLWEGVVVLPVVGIID